MTDVATERTFRLMYRSHDLIPATERKVALGELFTGARSNNKSQGITGALVLTDDWFVQVLEGDETAVRDLFAHIEKDPRHDKVTVLDEQNVASRVFARWAMAKVTEDGHSDIPLIAHADGIAPSAGHPTTSEQSALLQVMRAAAMSPDVHPISS